MAEEQILYLYKKCIGGTASSKEQEALLHWLQQPENEQAAKNLLKQSFLERKSLEEVPDQLTHSILNAISNANKNPLDSEINREPAVLSSNHRLHFLHRPWVRYAAAIMILLGGAATYVLYNHSNEKLPAHTITSKQFPTIPSGGQKATLTLADGSIIVLDSAANGLLTNLGNINILKLNEGAIAYSGAGSKAHDTSANLYNTISTPKGGQYQITLPDGSRVYLNAASSMRFPTNFMKQRTVVITGEAYFEIKKNPQSPFHVIINNQMDVEVLGTSFNVMAYSDEASINTTLLEGSVRINKGNKNIILLPGEQARVAEGITLLKNADVDKAIAWKNGFLNFEGVGLREMMRQLQRWYDIEVVYSGDVQDVTFFGKISRKVDLSSVLEALEGFGLHYKMQGRKLIVMAPPNMKKQNQ